jgi:pilus assembly protein CpaC
LPLLPLGSTPQPSAEVQAKYEKYIDRTIDPENVLDLIEGRPRLMVFKQIPFRVQIADPAIADYQQITEREFSVVGQKIGTTVLNFWFADPLDRTKQEILSYLLRVMPDPEAKERMDRVYEALEREINRKFPNSVISLSLVGDKLLIEGQAKDVEEAAHILDIVGRNAPGGPETIPLENINLDVVAVPGPDGELPAYGLENFLLRSQHSTVINRLRIPGVHQVMLKVTVAEVNRSAVRAIGASMAIGELGNAVSFFNFTPEGGAAGLLTDVATGGRLLIDKGDFKLSIDALRTLGLARALAEPNLVTLNGRPANLLVGGSFPIPQTQAFTNSSIQSVDFVPFGVSLSFTPVVVDKDRVRLSVFATISTRDEETGTSINGSNVPGLQARSFSTMVELREGQTLAVAGLVQNSYGANSERVPFLGDLPIVGRIFRRDGTSFDEQELMVLITPMLVEPLNCAQHQELPLPGHDIYEPDDIEFFLLGNLEGHYRQDYRSPARTDWWRMREFRNLQKQFIIGPSGHSDGH